MRILFNSRDPQYKSPSGVLPEGRTCRLSLDIPQDVRAILVEVLLEGDGRTLRFPLPYTTETGDYQRFSGEFTLPRGIYFYSFYVHKREGGFRLFKEGDGTNMEAGDRWQLSCVDVSATVPDWARGAVFYQIFPDRFHRSGSCDLTGKLEPYRVHAAWGEDPDWRPNAQGEITNSDFFGGNLRGITEKLPELRQLGVTGLYLNPIFMAWSNHRYDTADYRRIDPMLGTEADFRTLCETAHGLGMRVILDGVFSHTGDRASYFRSAVSDPASPYRSWYLWKHWPDSYEAWWGFRTLPCLDKLEPGYVNFLIGDADSVAAHWLRLGADGWRLDVVDELPDEFVLALKRRIRREKPDALLIGEVWEDASSKVAYGQRRRYFVDGELDSVMNYPLRNAILAYVLGRDDGTALGETILTLLEQYPREVLDCCMTLLSTHDTARALTVLGSGDGERDGGREVEAARRLSPEGRRQAVERLRLASVLQFTMPGAPTIYYADEAGMEGGKDPFNRRCYPWGQEDLALRAHYHALGALRTRCEALRTGSFVLLEAGGGVFAFRRDNLLVVCNRGPRVCGPYQGVPRMGRGLELTGDSVSVGHDGYVVLETETG
ncbi:MAG: glycoside hydrolase family 13 protein [Oscillospiraceae bacterium]|nr:glycoside hydrolase family 13 protein [Oscillospiraceae bacterium]